MRSNTSGTTSAPTAARRSRSISSAGTGRPDARQRRAANRSSLWLSRSSSVGARSTRRSTAAQSSVACSRRAARGSATRRRRRQHVVSRARATRGAARGGAPLGRRGGRPRARRSTAAAGRGGRATPSQPVPPSSGSRMPSIAIAIGFSSAAPCSQLGRRSSGKKAPEKRASIVNRSAAAPPPRRNVSRNPAFATPGPRRTG